MSENVFENFDNDWKNAEIAAPGGNLGRLPEGVYRGIFVAVDRGDGIPVDNEPIDNSGKGGSIGLKVFLEVIEPEKVGEVITKHKPVEHVFWVTQKTLPYIKRDVKTIFGKELPSAGMLPKIHWAGHTVEFGVRDEEYNGYVNSRIKFFAPWSPKAGTPAKTPTSAPAAPSKAARNAPKEAVPAEAPIDF